MGLDFTNIPDHEGAALYILHTANSREVENFQRLAAEITTQSSHQVILLDVKTADGEKVRDFYDITPDQLPAALVIRDDDSIAHQWLGQYIPTTASDIIYHLRQTSHQ